MRDGKRLGGLQSVLQAGRHVLLGTLDNDTLEIAASAVEDLGANGRIVGLVTHQQSLADKIAVPFRVNKGPVAATVEKVVA